MNVYVSIVCPSCGKKLKARQKDTGKVYVNCNNCNFKINSYMFFRKKIVNVVCKSK